MYDEERWPLFVGTSADARKLPKEHQWCAIDKYGIKNGPAWTKQYRDAAGGDKMLPDDEKAFDAALAKLGEQPADRALRDKWFDQYDKIITRARMPAIKTGVKRIRDEIKRLDKLWNGHTPTTKGTPA